MKGISASLASVALILNLMIAALGGLGPGELMGDDIVGEDGFELSDVSTVTVPPERIGDMVSYDSRIYAVWYGENTSSGEFDKIEIIALGQTTLRISNVKSARDGFFQTHQCISKEIITSGQVDIVYTNNTSSITITGFMDMDRAEHYDLTTVRPVAINNEGNMRLSGLGSIIGTPGQVGELKFSGDMRTWPDLTREYKLTLEQQIYGMGQTINLGDMGTVFQPNELAEEWALPYNWTAEQGLNIHGHDTIKMNITSNLWDVFPYTKNLWIAESMPFPARVFDRANYTGEYPERNYSEYAIIENERVLRKDGYTRGTTDIPWTGSLGEPTVHKYLDRSPYGEFLPWHDNRAPVGGNNFQASSFDMSTEEALDFAIANSEGLRDFIAEYPDATIGWGRYNSTSNRRDPQEGIYYWNMTLGHKPTSQEMEEYRTTGQETGVWYAPWRYRVTVKKEVVDDGSGYKTTYLLEDEYLYNRSANGKNMYDYEETALTMVGFENIIYQDPKVRAECFEDGSLIWNTYSDASHDPLVNDESIQLGLSTGDAGSEALQDIISMILGLNMPVFDFVGYYSKGSVGEDGGTYDVNVNLETGQLIGVASVEGTPFMSLFE